METMVIGFSHASMTVTSSTDVMELKKAIIFKKQWVYLPDAHQYVNLNMVENIMVDETSM